MKIKLYALVLFVSLLPTGSALAQQELSQVLPLLQKYARTTEETQQVLQVFRTAQNPDVIFAAGARLVKIPPAKTQEPALWNLVRRSENVLKQTFAAVILTAMGSGHNELLPVLQAGMAGQDPVLRAYAAAATALIEPQASILTDDVVRLYIFDGPLAERALDKLTHTPQALFTTVKKAAGSSDKQVRAAAATWLAKHHSSQAAQQLLKIAKKEKEPEVQAAIANGLAAQREYTLETVEKALQRKYTSPYATTCALALGFMTGNGVTTVRQHLAHKNVHARINAARAAAYMASVLSNPEAFAYSSDRVFDIHLLKGLIPALTTLEQTGSGTEKTYATNALRQIEKLME